MAGYVIHIAIGNLIFNKNIKIMDSEYYENYIYGVIMPDYKKDHLQRDHIPFIQSRKLTHCLDMNKKIEELTAFELGYFVHLITDHYFYKFFKDTGSLYDDYDLTNKQLVEKYNLKLPTIIKEDIVYKEGIPKVLKLEELCNFIEDMSNLNLKKEYKKFKKTEMNSKYIGKLTI